MKRDDAKILDAKRRLYAVLLATSNDELTAHEIDIAYALASDGQIQDFLTKSIENERRTG